MGPPASAASRPKTSVSSIGSESGDETDNLKRQPSIRDRMKMFEAFGVEKGEKPGLERSVSCAASAPSVRSERRLDLESENKENKPEPEIPVARIEIQAGQYFAETHREKVIFSVSQLLKLLFNSIANIEPWSRARWTMRRS